MISRIETKPDLDALSLEKKAWIIERLREMKDDKNWLTNFLKFLTGQTYLSPDLRLQIKFHSETHFKGATCIYTLFVPKKIREEENPFSDIENPSEKDIFYRLLDISILSHSTFNAI